MVVFYLDTSAILKRYKTEKGTDVVDQLYAGGETFLLTSHFSCLEFESVAAKALKGHIPGYALDEMAYGVLLGAFAFDRAVAASTVRIRPLACLSHGVL